METADLWGKGGPVGMDVCTGEGRNDSRFTGVPNTLSAHPHKAGTCVSGHQD